MKSITRYLLLNASIWAIAVAFASGLVLTSFFRTSAEQGFDEQLDIVLKILVGELAGQLLSSDPLVAPQNLGEPRYELPLSGWYWTLSNASSGEILLASASLVGGGLKLDAEKSKAGDIGSGLRVYGYGPGDKRLRILERRISFSQTENYIMRVTGNAEDLNDQVADFQKKAWLIMVAFGATLLAVTFFLVRTALRPLNILRQQVRYVAEGQASSIEGSYPDEVSGLVNEANILIASNKDTLERARTQVGNLAHALKTPLSVITNEVRHLDGPKGKMLSEQADVMRDQIQMYLERARMAARRNVIGSVTPAYPVLDKLVEVMRKIHGSQKIELLCEDTEDISFRGEKQDLEELVGNLIDNGCKWADTAVRVTLLRGRPKTLSKSHHTTASDKNGWFTILVEDDGAGMSDVHMDVAMQRGQRLDESKPGTGLGLSIVEEMAVLYQGQFTLERSDLGGICATLILPALDV
ncbi:ATP-binding protein [Cohaesibacter celericrescens]|uniref:ATP-binding protein n=1 Tax=Cohaesibacter celericrescens TaxID=2067669 RepID=UPI0035675206